MSTTYVEKQGMHTVTEASTVWELPLPDTAVEHSATVDIVQDGNGSRIDVDSQIQTAVPSLLISFGLDEHTGTARYSWLETIDDTQTITSGMNTVTINVTQNGGTTPSGSTF